MILTNSENMIHFAMTIYLTDVKVEWIQVGGEFSLDKSFTSLGEEKPLMFGLIFVLFDNEEIISLYFKLPSPSVDH